MNMTMEEATRLLAIMGFAPKRFNITNTIVITATTMILKTTTAKKLSTKHALNGTHLFHVPKIINHKLKAAAWRTEQDQFNIFSFLGFELFRANFNRGPARWAGRQWVHKNESRRPCICQRGSHCGLHFRQQLLSSHGMNGRGLSTEWIGAFIASWQINRPQMVQAKVFIYQSSSWATMDKRVSLCPLLIS